MEDTDIPNRKSNMVKAEGDRDDEPREPEKGRADEQPPREKPKGKPALRTEM